jgi:hypothetical protein
MTHAERQRRYREERQRRYREKRLDAKALKPPDSALEAILKGMAKEVADARSKAKAAYRTGVKIREGRRTQRPSWEEAVLRMPWLLLGIDGTLGNFDYWARRLAAEIDKISAP